MDDVSLTDMIAPIPGEPPVGTDARGGGAGSELYLLMKDERASARSAEREALAAADPELDPLTAGSRSWAEVARAGGELLAHHSKDLQAAAWVVEAWLRIDGLPGLADGFTLLAELVEHYWDEGLYPVEDEDGVDSRLAPLFGLFGREEAGTLIQPIKLLPLTDLPNRHVALWAIEAVRAQTVRHDDPEIREELAAKHRQRIAELDAAVSGASATFASASIEAIERALAELDRLMEDLDRYTPQGRFGSQVTSPLIAIADLLRQHHALPAAEVMQGRSIESAPPQAAAPGAPTTAPKQNVMDRKAAFATLLEIAGFFERNEPQSLIGHGLRDLVRRANLSIDDLLTELLPDREQRATFLLRAGIRTDGAGGGDAGGVTTY